MHELIQSLSNYDAIWIYITIFVVAFSENLFPPSPSDVLVVFGAALAAIGHGYFLFVLLSGTLGGTFGFMTMYIIGKWFGNSIIEKGKIKFIPIDRIHDLELWFKKYGYWIIVINRFFTGTRAVISFFAGMSGINFITTVLLSFIGSLIWYSILVYTGYTLGNNWERIGDYLRTYSLIITVILCLVAAILILKYLYNRKRKNG